VTNELNGETARESFLDLTQFESGNYILRVLAADFFGNISTQDTLIEIK
jgi:hypothetical protein